MSIHILGAGAIGCLMGASLRLTNNKVTLLLRSKAHLKDFCHRQNNITYRCRGETKTVGSVDAQVMSDEGDPIASLIVSTKANHTLKALEPLASRLTPESTVVLLQNGMGVAEELREHLWKDPSRSPDIYVGVNRHAVHRIAPFDIHHHSGYADPKAFRLGQFPNPKKKTNTPNPLVQQILAIPDFQAALVPWRDLQKQMITKLFINACINGVASVLMCKNKGTIYQNNPGAMALMRSICDEAYEVFKDDLPGETADSMMEIVLNVNREAAENTCSTLHDLQRHQFTEIDYINGYVCKMGYQRGVNVKSSQAIVHLIHAKEALYSLKDEPQ
ncbi:2-dehydropantoate 2-reductase [Blakeslea trispora]|nr:2-dehydropantoate 2-reductase [Blakeslea trispora]